jgi:hypothetical protein
MPIKEGDDILCVTMATRLNAESHPLVGHQSMLTA